MTQVADMTAHDELIKIVSKNIKLERTEACYTQEEWARRLGVGRSALSNWEQGNCLPTLTQAVLICKAIGMSLDELVGLDGDRT